MAVQIPLLESNGEDYRDRIKQHAEFLRVIEPADVERLPPNFLPHQVIPSSRPSDITAPTPLSEIVKTIAPLDTVWAKLYMLSMAALFSTSILIWLETEVPKSISLTDTIYTVLGGSLSILGFDTLFAIAVSIIWFILLRTCVQPLLHLLVYSIPISLAGLSIYPLVMSYHDRWGGNTTQDRAMRWTSLFPAILAVFWVWFAIKSRNSLGRAVGIVQLACKILGENPALIFLSLGVLLSFTAFTWMWVAMFTRVFLRGRTVSNSSGLTIWILDKNSWLLGAWYIIMYLWTWGVFSGVQRVATTLTVSQWYFHRPTSEDTRSVSKAIILTSVSVASTSFAGTICFSAFIALLIRLPLLVLPRKVVSIIQAVLMNYIAGPISAITNPITLSYSAVKVEPLVASASGISNQKFIDLGRNSPFPNNTWHAYRLAKMLLSSARALTALVLGFGAWVHAAQDVNGGSLYGYVVGLVGGAIGWVVLGATEGNLSMIVDAAFVCFGIDQVNNHGGHCSEADRQFGGFS
ncbi:hypothetical protein V1511DRAFT_455129 [Dipodascopsis uninucleata]